MRGPFASLLRVPEDGFSWRDGLVVLDGKGVGENIAGPWLIRRNGLYVRQYSPLAVPDLHRRFARTEPTDKSILAFANKYGFLGHSLALRDPELHTVRIDEIPVGESLEFWRHEIVRMVRLMALWELVKGGCQRELSHLVQWTPQGEPQQVRLYLVVLDGKIRPDLTEFMRQSPHEFHNYVYQNDDLAGRMLHWEVTVLAYQENASDVELLERWVHGDPIEPARYFVHREVNKRLRGHVNPAVLPYRKGEIYFFPDCLRGALYTLFMLELSGRQRPAILCARPGCGGYFKPGHGRQRYCDKLCQQLAYYYRRKEKLQTN